MTTETDIVNRLSESLVETPSGCWEFVGARFGEGYGAMRVDGKQVSTHRLSYMLEHGPIPKSVMVCHSCDNPPCCRPDHLFLGTVQDNKADEISKGRHVFGERVGNHKLTQDDVRAIKIRLAEGIYSLQSIADEFTVTKQAIHQIKTGQNWGWLQ